MNVDYQDGDTLLEGYVAKPKKLSGKTPAVMVVHDWSGKNKFACKKADKLAELGYIGVAVDMYGKGKVGKTKEEKTELMSPLMQNRSLLRQRILAAFETVKNMPEVDKNHIGCIGFCFGGLVALDLARSGAHVSGVVSFHGLLGAPDDLANEEIQSKVLVLHGYDDPMVPPDQVIAFASEMKENLVDWQIHMYGNTLHAFTNPEANDLDFGTVYEPTADKRSWTAMQNFFTEVF